MATILTSILIAVFTLGFGMIIGMGKYIWEQRKQQLEQDRAVNLEFQKEVREFLASQRVINDHFDKRLEKLEEKAA